MFSQQHQPTKNMGLDMYLSCQKYFSGYDHNKDPNYQRVLDLIGIQESDAERSATVEVVIGYWRKATAIHRWFVENVQGGRDDCRKYYVSREKLEQLRCVSFQALECYERGDREGAMLRMPTNAGKELHYFLMGHDHMEEYLADDLRLTLKIVDRALGQKFNGMDDFIYQSSW